MYFECMKTYPKKRKLQKIWPRKVHQVEMQFKSIENGAGNDTKFIVWEDGKKS